MKKLITFIKSLFAKKPKETESFKITEKEILQDLVKAPEETLEGIATVVESTTMSPIIREAQSETIVEEYEISEEEYQQEVAAGSKDVVSEDQGDPVPVRKKRVTKKKKK